jgi:hypothetical protein
MLPATSVNEPFRSMLIVPRPLSPTTGSLRLSNWFPRKEILGPALTARSAEPFADG